MTEPYDQDANPDEHPSKLAADERRMAAYRAEIERAWETALAAEVWRIVAADVLAEHEAELAAPYLDNGRTVVLPTWAQLAPYYGNGKAER